MVACLLSWSLAWCVSWMVGCLWLFVCLFVCLFVMAASAALVTKKFYPRTLLISSTFLRCLCAAWPGEEEGDNRPWTDCACAEVAGWNFHGLGWNGACHCHGLKHWCDFYSLLVVVGCFFLCPKQSVVKKRLCMFCLRPSCREALCFPRSLPVETTPTLILF